MSLRALVILSAFVVSGIVQGAAAAWAGGPADIPSCVVPNPGSGAIALRGTVAVGVQDAATQASTNVDFTLRLERGGALAFFRVSLFTQVYARSNEGILCDLLNDSASPAALQLRGAILQKFGFRSTSRFVITDKSVSNAEIQGTSGQWLCNETYTDPATLTPSCTEPRAASMADVTIHVLP